MYDPGNDHWNVLYVLDDVGGLIGVDPQACRNQNRQSGISWISIDFIRQSNQMCQKSEKEPDFFSNSVYSNQY